MTTTPRLGITQLEEDQALPEVVVNEGVLKLEGYATRAILKSKGDNDPPGSPAEGDMYLIGGTGTGAWTGHDNQLAQYVNGAWDFDTPKEGFEIEVEDEDTSYTLRGGSWVQPSAASGAVTSSGLTMSTARLLGRTTASTGAIEEITVGSGLSLAAGNLTATGGGATIDVEDEGVLEASASTINFTGAGVTATDQGGGVVDIDIPGVAGATAWALAGTGQTATGVYNFAVDGAKANIDFTGLGSFNELLIIGRGLSWTVSGVRIVQVSVDNGSTWFTTSGDYVINNATGTETNTTAFGHTTSTTVARSLWVHIVNTKGVEKYADVQNNSGFQYVFVGSASDIDAIRFTNSGGGNSGAGTVRVYAR